MTSEDKKQPEWNLANKLTTPRFHGGGRRAVNRLAQLKFDPIGELVVKYRELEREVTRQEGIRDGTVIEKTSTGRVRAYNAMAHHALYDRLIAISDKLLRYGYGRVPETTIVENKALAPLTINLTKEGDTYVVNAPGDFDDDLGDASEAMDDQYLMHDDLNDPYVVKVLALEVDPSTIKIKKPEAYHVD